MQITGRHETLATEAEAHEDLAGEVTEDGRVTRRERSRLLVSAHRLCLSILRQGIRIKLGVRVIRGGAIDRRLLSEIKDYQQVVEQEKAATCLEQEAA